MATQQLCDYLSFRQGTHLNYHRAADIGAQDYRTLVSQAQKFVQEDKPTNTLSSSDDPNTVIELSIRKWTGYGAPQNKPEAAAGWMYVAHFREDVPLPLKARAHSSLAKAWLDLAHENAPGTLNIDRLYDAGKSANDAISLGLISPAVLKVAARIEDLGFRRPEDNKFPEHSTERFERLIDLWEVLDARKAEMVEEDSKRATKVSKDPLSYFCAAEDCGIVVTKRRTLKKCGGECPRQFKPSYCSKYCQTVDRKHHRPYCRSDATESSVCQTEGTSTTSVKERPEEPEEDIKLQPGAERTIDVNIGGRNIRIASSTMGPQMLREVRENLRRL